MVTLQHAPTHFEWQRFWCPSDGGYSLADGGYLVDPTQKGLIILKSDAAPFGEIDLKPCLALLGEPGMGKSIAIQDIQRTVAGRSNQHIFFDLKSYGSEERLCRDLFESEAFRAWAGGTTSLELFIDSLDECLLRITTVADILVTELRKHLAHISHLRLRIACRTAEWPTGLTRELIGLWGNTELVGVYELTPLRRVDVIVAAHGYGLDPESFLSEVYRVRGVPLAIKPVTLHFLLGTFRRNGALPPTQLELYRQGCLLLSEETSPSRRRKQILGKLSPAQRLKVPGRIAAITVFCNRSTIYDGIGPATDSEAVVPISSIAGETEGSGTDSFKVTEVELREVLSTALFSSRGPDRLGWAHQTYAEFLASNYLCEHGASLIQILSLIRHPGDDSAHIVPQLHETAAWLANTSSNIRHELLLHDPAVLMRSDVAAADEQTRRQLVDSLLTLIDREELMDWQQDWRHQYNKLAHPGLETQLKPYLVDKSESVFVRRFVMDIVREAEL